MLAAPNVRKPSKLPTILVVVALASAVAYFAFFRHRPQPVAPSAPPTVADKRAVPAPATKLEIATVEAPRVETPAPRTEAPRKSASAEAAVGKPVPVVFTPPPSRSAKTETDELIA